MKKSLLIFAACVCAAFSFPNITVAAEVIKNFRSDIFVQLDGSIDVKETIVVNAENKQIKHGIYRDIPTTYRGNDKKKYDTGFALTEVKQDGATQKYRVENQKNGVRIYIGDSERDVATGIHEYEIGYTMRRALGYFETHDELYWNVTGNEWTFPIEKVEAHVSLPESISATDTIEYRSYFGQRGDKANRGVSRVDSVTSAYFETAQPLSAREGYTIAVLWPKNRVAEPVALISAGEISLKHQIIAAILGFFALSLYFFVIWFRSGRDPRANVVIAHYEPPAQMSPAFARYLLKHTFDHAAFAAQLIDMAARSLISLRISKNGGDYFIDALSLEGKKVGAEDTIILENLFKNKKTIKIEKHPIKNTSDRVRLRAAELQLSDFLKSKIIGPLFRKNQKEFWFGVIVVLPTIIMMMKVRSIEGISGVLVFSGFYFLAYFALRAFARMKVMPQNNAKSFFAESVQSLKNGFLIVFAFVFLMASMGLVIRGVLTVYIGEASIVDLVFWISIGAIVVLFAKLLPRYTEDGARFVEHLKGFKLFLSATEKERFEFHHPPDVTPELFQKYLSYACAFGVQKSWGKNLGSALASSLEIDLERKNYLLISQNFSSLSSAISSSAQSLSYSSGSGGSGSSGGGQGGGGGGGW